MDDVGLPAAFYIAVLIGGSALLLTVASYERFPHMRRALVLWLLVVFVALCLGLWRSYE